MPFAKLPSLTRFSRGIQRNLITGAGRYSSRGSSQFRRTSFASVPLKTMCCARSEEEKTAIRLSIPAFSTCVPTYPRSAADRHRGGTFSSAPNCPLSSARIFRACWAADRRWPHLCLDTCLLSDPVLGMGSPFLGPGIAPSRTDIISAAHIEFCLNLLAVQY
jgi:hypothetical protein